MAKRGRKPQYGPDVEQAILERLENGEPLRAICRSRGMPDERSVRKWCESRDHFGPQYARARDIALDAIAEGIRDTARKGTGDVARDRLIVDTDKWYVAKLAPKRYGDRVAVDHGAQDSLAEVLKAIDGRTAGLHNTPQDDA